MDQFLRRPLGSLDIPRSDRIARLTTEEKEDHKRLTSRRVPIVRRSTQHTYETRLRDKIGNSLGKL